VELMSSSDEQGAKLRDLWAGEFGDAYIERNIDAVAKTADFWRGMLTRFPAASALEVGCNVGGNLIRIAEQLGATNVAGVDVNENALAVLAERLPDADLRCATAVGLPFTDDSFDLVFTMGVLIHVAPNELEPAMREVVRCSRRYVLAGEYYAPEVTELPYRGERGALYKRDYGALYEALDAGLRLAETGFLPLSEGAFDDVTYWLFEVPGSQTTAV
jgi:pseudaminic acid biosynthesis-associated methylase